MLDRQYKVRTSSTNREEFPHAVGKSHWKRIPSAAHERRPVCHLVRQRRLSAFAVALHFSFGHQSAHRGHRARHDLRQYAPAASSGLLVARHLVLFQSIAARRHCPLRFPPHLSGSPARRFQRAGDQLHHADKHVYRRNLARDQGLRPAPPPCLAHRRRELRLRGRRRTRHRTGG